MHKTTLQENQGTQLLQNRIDVSRTAMLPGWKYIYEVLVMMRLPGLSLALQGIRAWSSLKSQHAPMHVCCYRVQAQVHMWHWNCLGPMGSSPAEAQGNTALIKGPTSPAPLP